MTELDEKKLEDVSGGTVGPRFNIQLIGPYWGTVYKESGPFSDAIGWTNLSAERAVKNGLAPFRILHNGVAIGFTVEENFIVV